MAIASLVLSFAAFLVPLGIASVVLGHISRSQIAKSAGRQTGTALAFAGLIISYLQLVVVGLIALSVLSAWHNLNRKLENDPTTRAALVERIKNGDPYHHSGSQVEQHRQHAIAALRNIADVQTEYLYAHPQEGYACRIDQLPGGDAAESDLNQHLINSHYEIKIDQCRGSDDQRYAVVAIPRSDNNPPDSPVFCLNQTGVIRKYPPNRVNDVNIAILFQHQSCPEGGETLQ